MRFETIKNVSNGHQGYRIIEKGENIGKLYYDIEGNTFIIDYIIINKTHRNKGLAKKALLKILKKDYKCFKTTTIAKSNVASHALFKSLGFKEKPSGKQITAKYCK